MSSKTKIVVLHMKEVIYTGIFVVFAIVLAVLLFMMFGKGKEADTASAQALRQAVLQAAVQCYAVEGSYPASLDYLEENYGLLVNHDRFIVTYEAFASNLMPQVNVLERA